MVEINIPKPDESKGDIFDFGFDKTLNRATGANSTPTVYDTIEDRLQGSMLSLGALLAGTGNTMIVADPTKGLWLGHEKYDSAPFKVSMQGELNASSGVFSGAITATSGTIGGFTVGADYIRDAADSMGMASTVTGGDDVRFWAGDTFANRATADFRVTESGALTATSGTIGGFTLSTTTLTATNLTLTAGAANTANILVGTGATAGGLNSANAGTDIAIWAGSTHAGRAAAAFRVNAQGDLTASSATITGGAITGTPIASIPNNSSTDISILEKTWTMVFSVTDNNTVAWTSGTITLSNGRTFSISSGNTGNMAALSYIYLDPAVSTTVLQVTTTAATAMGANKCLIGTAQNNTVTASFIPYGPGQPLVDGANIGALSIVAGNIAASTITAGKMNVSQLSAIAADIGAITAGTIVLSSAGHIRAGQTAFDTGTGFFLGIESSTPKFSVGNSAGNKVTWDGTTFVVVGKTPTVQTYNSSDTWTKPTGLVFVLVEVWGAGGSGACSTSSPGYTGGGGGGGYASKTIRADDLGATETVTVGAGGAAKTGNNDGAAGGNSSFGSHVTAYGGGGGADNGGQSAGGGGGGFTSAGSSTTGTTGGDGGGPVGGTGTTSTGEKANFGGGAGGGHNSSTGFVGGSSVYGGGGGGGSGSSGSAGGGSSYAGGGGGAGAQNSSGGTSVLGGAGGGEDTNGTAPGGGGGAADNNGPSGAGAAGRVKVTEFYS